MNGGPAWGRRIRQWWQSRAARWLGIALLCWVTAFAAVNLRSTAAGSIVRTVVPRIEAGNPIDDDAIQAEWGLIQGNYVFRDVSGQLGTQGSEQGMVEALDQQFHDRFTSFLTHAEYAELQATLSGQRSGSIGIAIEARCAGAAVCAAGTNPSEVVIEDVLVGQPAAVAGIRPGDALVAVGSTRIPAPGANPSAALSLASQKIRGAPGTTVTITVDRGGTLVTVTVRRADLHIPSVYSRRFGRVLYLQVTGFDSGTADTARQMLRSALNAGATSVIVDLRENGGGFVAEAQSLASQFLRPGSPPRPVVIRRGRLAPSGSPTSAQSVVRDQVLGGGVALSEPMVVLVDDGTASAAEIVTAALADYHRATTIGTKTFGKGSVQLDYPLPDGSDLHLTVERWYGPNGESIDGAGITPATTVTLGSPDSRFRLDSISPPPARDAQLEAALAALSTT